MDGSVSFTATSAVMPLPGALLFPHALLPLTFLKEPLSRDARARAWSSPHVSVALVKPECGEWKSPSDFFHVAGVGLIRALASVKTDGTSNLILQGLERVRFTGFEQEAPFPIATIEPLECGRYFLSRNRSARGKGSRALFETKNEGARTSGESRSLSFRS